MNRCSQHLLVATVVLLGCAHPGAVADPASPAPATYPVHAIGNSQIRSLPQSANGRDYMLYVALPYSYAEDPNRTYPVLYLCDGYWDFTLVNGFYGNLLHDQVIPEFFIVGFGYAGETPDYAALRKYDYTPVPDPVEDPSGAESGHAAEFLTAIEEEIIPFIEREYRVDPAYRVLGGSSSGGLFTLYSLFARPGLFQAYIAPSPAVSWADDWLFGFAAATAERDPPIQARLFMTGAGEEDPEFLGAIRRFHRQLQSGDDSGLAYRWRLIEGERHAGTKAESYTRGIRFAFEPLLPTPEPDSP